MVTLAVMRRSMRCLRSDCLTRAASSAFFRKASCLCTSSWPPVCILPSLWLSSCFCARVRSLLLPLRCLVPICTYHSIHQALSQVAVSRSFEHGKDLLEDICQALLISGDVQRCPVTHQPWYTPSRTEFSPCESGGLVLTCHHSCGTRRANVHVPAVCCTQLHY